MSYQTSDIRKGLKIEMDGAPWIVVDFQFVKPGKGQAFTRTKIKNLLTGNTIDRTYKTGETLEEADIEEKNMSFLYADSEMFHFMDTDDFQQVAITPEVISDAKQWLIEGMQTQVLFYKQRPVSLVLPNFVDLEITYCEPGARGNTATGTNKQATVSTGAQVGVPLFIETGEIIRVDTRTGEYVGRAELSSMGLSAEGLRARAAVLRAVRHWFDGQGYLEVPTPVLVPSPAMEEHLFAVPAGGGFLRTSPEFALKRVAAAGLPRIYEIGACFRERESGPWHGREFTMLEWYRAGASPDDVMDEVEAIVTAAADALGVADPGPWRRATVRELFREATGIDLAKASADDLTDRDEPWDDAFLRRWVADVEPTFRGALFVTEWPASQAALAQVRTNGEWPVAMRFEAFLHGVELANGFLELLDSREQLRRFAAANAARDAAGEAAHPIDAAFVRAVGRMPRTTGIAVGLDRLVAALSGWDGIGPGRADHPGP